MVFECFHTNNIFRLEPNNCNLVLFDEARSFLFFLPCLLVHKADQGFQSDLFYNSLQMEDELLASADNAIVVDYRNLKLNVLLIKKYSKIQMIVKVLIIF